MQEGYWVVRTYEAGAVGEKTKFWVNGTRPYGKLKKKDKDQLKKQEQNEYSAVKRLARLINANFHEGDIILGLDYSDAGMERLKKYAAAHPAETTGDKDADELESIRLAAERELKLALRRTKRELQKDGVELRYIAVTSDMDGDTGESVRVHHHLVIGAEAREAFEKKWCLGSADWSVMSDQIDYTPIAEYFMRQVRRVPDAKKYVSSRNLIRPQPKDRVVLTDAEIRVPKGGKLLYRNSFTPGSPQYIRYMLPRDKWQRNRNTTADIIKEDDNGGNSSREKKISSAVLSARP